MVKLLFSTFDLQTVEVKKHKLSFRFTNANFENKFRFELLTRWLKF